MTACKTVAALLAAAATTLAAADKALSPEEATLQGLAGVRVEVNVTAREVAAKSFDRDGLARAVESQLRKGGVALLERDERAQGMPTLAINLLVFSVDGQADSPCVYSVESSFSQDVRLIRNPAIKLSAPTWRGAGSVGTVAADSLDELRAHVEREVERFVAAYKTAAGL